MSKKVTQKDFYPVLYGGVLGGAAHAVSDHYFDQFMPGQTTPIESLGMSLKDIALVYLGIWASKNHAKKAWQKQSLEGMSTIAVYKTLYPKFLEPTVTKWLAGA